MLMQQRESRSQWSSLGTSCCLGVFPIRTALSARRHSNVFDPVFDPVSFTKQFKFVRHKLGTIVRNHRLRNTMYQTILNGRETFYPGPAKSGRCTPLCSTHCLGYHDPNLAAKPGCPVCQNRFLHFDGYHHP